MRVTLVYLVLAGVLGMSASRTDSYRERIQQQLTQYKNMSGGQMQQLPGIAHYWSSKHLVPMLTATFNDSHVLSDADRIMLVIEREYKNTDHLTLLSIGAGACLAEVDLATRLVGKGYKLDFHAIELNPALLEQGQSAVHNEGLDSMFHFHAVDINRWEPSTHFDIVIAIHSLHHMVELERIFDTLHRSMSDSAVFYMNDMIGRNGHARWPEVKGFIDKIWPLLPRRLTYHPLSKSFLATFVDHDCSSEGFEGIRAQDILPLLIPRFNFSYFVAFGGLTDIFRDRLYGHNLQPRLSYDRHLIDFLQYMEDMLLSLGYIKPTQLIAVATKMAVSQPHTRPELPPLQAVRRPY